MGLNDDSMKRISTIARNFRAHPTYASYNIREYCHDWRKGVQALEVSKNGTLINLFLFFPSYNGKIESIALYGKYLQGHYNAMRSSMKAFGMNISSITMETGASDFLDIYLDY